MAPKLVFRNSRCVRSELHPWAGRMMLGLALLLGSMVAVGFAIVGCAPAAPPVPTAAAAAPAAAPAAPTAAPAAPPKAVEPTKVAAVPTTEPTKVAAAQPVAAAKVEYPVKGKAITMIVPWAAGGGTDIAARLMAAGLEKELGTSVQVANKAGAASQVGLSDLVAAKPDGYIVGVTNQPASLVTYLDEERKAPYARKDFQPIAGYVVDPMALAVKGDSKFKTVKDLVDAGKANPAKVKVANLGPLSVAHLAVLSLESVAGVRFAGVSMEAPEMTRALLGGDLDAACGGAANWTAQLKSGQVRYLGILDSQESKFYPGVPTLVAQGYQVLSFTTHGLSAPAGTPKEIVAILSDAAKKVTADNTFKDKMNQVGLDPRFMDSAQFDSYWAQLERDTAVLIKQAKQNEATK